MHWIHDWIDLVCALFMRSGEPGKITPNKIQMIGK
jgi:hypothetical protein